MAVVGEVRFGSETLDVVDQQVEGAPPAVDPQGGAAPGVVGGLGTLGEAVWFGGL